MPSTTRHAPVTSEFTELVRAGRGWLHEEFDAITTAIDGRAASGRHQHAGWR